jgi:hypothetical protein
MGVSTPILENERKAYTMSVAEEAAMLISHSNDYIQNAMTRTNTTSDSLGRAIEALGQLRTVTADSMSTVRGLLGEGHPSAAPLSGLAEAVNVKADEIQSAMSSIVEMVIELDGLANTYCSTVSSVGHIILQGG